MQSESNDAEEILNITRSVIEVISRQCQCLYSVSLVIGGILFCDDNRNQLIYQAKFLPMVNLSSEDARSLTQNWVHTQPSIVINSQPYKLDPSCPVVVKMFGKTTCEHYESTTESESESSTVMIASSRSPSVYELASIVGVGLILLILVTVVIVLCVVVFIKRKSRKYGVTKHRDGYVLHLCYLHYNSERNLLHLMQFA